ncbi:OpS4 FAD-dependent monooxygenase OpS4 [Candida maltosa Xu316]
MGSFNIIICGGGLAGLACAIGLTKKGHKVTVLEASPELGEVGAGIQIPPNAVRVLSEYGILDKFTPIVTKPKSLVVRRYDTGEVLSTTPFDPHTTDTYGYPYFVIHRADYLKILYDSAIESSVHVIMNARVDKVDVETTTVILTTGEQYTADLIIGADGIRSKVRDTAVVTDETVLPLPSAHCAYRATIPRDVMLADPLIAHLMTDVNSNCWIGYRRHIMAYPIRNGEMYNMVLVNPGQAPVGKWNVAGDLEEMRNHYKTYDPVVQRLLSHVTSTLQWVLADMPKLPRWVKGNVALIGDAAHAMLPYLAQGAAQAIEDGATLISELDAIDTVDEIPAALVKYQKRRVIRAQTIQAGARNVGDTWHLPDGDEQVERDAKMKARDDDNPSKWANQGFQQWLFGWNAFTNEY